MSAAITLEDVTLSYQRHPAVHHVSGRFESGSLTAVTGPNGAGKSTLLKGLAGILTPNQGRIIIDETFARQIAYLPQAADIQRDFPLSALELVASGSWRRAGAWGAISQMQRQAAKQALAQMGLAGFEKRQIGSLSAGQFQRALFARLLLQDARIILLDEPFTAVDADTSAKLLAIIAQWHAQGRTVICVLHDFGQILAHFPQCLLLARECIAWGNSSEVLQPQALQNARVFREAWQPHSEICPQ